MIFQRCTLRLWAATLAQHGHRGDGCCRKYNRAASVWHYEFGFFARW